MKILVVAGEESADLHTAHVMKALRATHSFELFGIGGLHLKDLGAELIASPQEMAAMGFTEVLGKIPQTFRLLKKLEALAQKKKPSLIFLTDLPEFNLRLAERLKKKLNIPIIYYISPKVWIWRKYRVNHMARYIDLLLCIFPFEKDWFKKNFPNKLRVEYVGNPILEQIPALPYEAKENQISLVPGSREREIKTLLPIFLEAAVEMKKKYPGLQFVLPLATNLRVNPMIKEFLSREGPLSHLFSTLGDSFSIVEDSAPEVFRSSKLAIIASGTATLEAAIVGTPMLVVYKLSRLTAFFFYWFIKYKGSVSLVNLIHKGLNSNSKVVPELLQEYATGENIAKEAFLLLESKVLWEEQRRSLSKTRSILELENLQPSKVVPKYIIKYL